MSGDHPEAFVRRRSGYQGGATSVQIGGVDRPTKRELDTNGIPITRRRSTVMDVHNRVRGKPRPPRPMAPEADDVVSPLAEVRAPQPQVPAQPPVKAGATGATPTPTASPRPTPSSRPPTPPATGTQPPAVTARQVAVAATAAAIATEILASTRTPSSERPAAPPPHSDDASASVAPATRPASKPVLTPPIATSTSGATRGHTATAPGAQPPASQSAQPQFVSGRSTLAATHELSDELREDLRILHEDWRDEVLHSHPERRCGSCRDFRASDTPGRGWCINAYAFPTRQLVSHDDLACLSNLGNWWVASDQGWLDKVGALPTQPTPLADGLIQLLKEAQRQRRQ